MRDYIKIPCGPLTLENAKRRLPVIGIDPLEWLNSPHPELGTSPALYSLGGYFEDWYNLGLIAELEGLIQASPKLTSAPKKMLVRAPSPDTNAWENTEL